MLCHFDMRGLAEIQMCRKIIGEEVELIASGRTDAGVHAYNQRAHFDLQTKITPDKIKMGLNSLIPDDIKEKLIHFLIA